MILASMKRNLAEVNERIERAAEKGRRDPHSITLVAVSKSVDREIVDAAYEAGLRQFGENRVQDAARKFEPKLPPDAKLHMIGQLQSQQGQPGSGAF
jgi:uncharacterized pyridoxal phosphate-containing UPF0001 family protein